MDIFRFINSADIRRYLAEIRYRFSTEEKMFLICYCKTATLNEKIAAWQEIVGYVPSCPWDYALDIRERVAAYIELQEKMLGQFQSAGSCVYQDRLAAAEETVSECSDNWLSNLDRTLARMRVRGDVSDVTCSGYTVSGNPGEAIPLVFNDEFFICDYLDLEYYRGQLKGIHKLLKPISDFLKGDRSIEYLLNTYCLAQQQAMLENSVAWFRNCYSKDSLADIGILPKTESSQEKT